MRAVDAFELLLPRAAHRQHDFVVQPIELFADGFVEPCQAEKGTLLQQRNHPTLHVLRLAFIFGFSDPRGQNGILIMLGQGLVGRVDVRLVVIGFRYPGDEVGGAIVPEEEGNFLTTGT